MGSGGYDRVEQTARVVHFERERQRRLGERAVAAEVGTPRSTLRSQCDRLARLDGSENEKAFFASPGGLRLLLRLLVVLDIGGCLLGACGIRVVCWILQASTLARFVASSHGAQQAFHAELRAHLEHFGVEERGRLAPTMAHRLVSLALDETFLSGLPCLLAMDVQANFVLLEKLVERRDETAWTDGLHEGFSGLNVEILQAVGDQGQALSATVRETFGAPKHFDLLHGQQTLSAATAPALSARVTAAEKVLAPLEAERKEHQARRDKLKAAGCTSPEVWLQLDKGWVEGEERFQSALESLQQAATWREEAREALREMGSAESSFDAKRACPTGGAKLRPRPTPCAAACARACRTRLAEVSSRCSYLWAW
jgi:hypothetical protein